MSCPNAPKLSEDLADVHALARRLFAPCAFAFFAGCCFTSVVFLAACAAGAGNPGSASCFRGLRAALAGADPCPHWCPAATYPTYDTSLAEAQPRADPLSTPDFSDAEGVAESRRGQSWEEVSYADPQTAALEDFRTPRRSEEAERKAHSATLAARYIDDSRGQVRTSAEPRGIARLDAAAMPQRRRAQEDPGTNLFGRVAQLEQELAHLRSEVARASAGAGHPQSSLGGGRRVAQHVRRMQENIDGAARDAAIARLVQEIRLHAPKEYVDRCVHFVEGNEGSLDSGFSGQGQDWAVFHNFFVNIPWGRGFYLDLAANDPRFRSNSVFFDLCLGWKGICVEPNPKYHPFYEEGSPMRKRTCTLVKSCISNRAKTAWIDFGLDGSAGLTDLPGKPKQSNSSRLTEVPCQSLDSILEEQGVKPGGLDFVSLDIEGSELPALFCFPFQKWKIPIWLVELAHSPPALQHHFLRNGYAQVLNILGWQRPNAKCSFGVLEDSIFALMDPPLALGPLFLPGRPLHGLHPRGMCSPGATGLSCPDQLPVMLFQELGNRTERGGDFNLGQCGAVMLNGAASSGEAVTKPPFDILSSAHPRLCLDQITSA